MIEMISPELQTYIQQKLSTGSSMEQISEELLQAGWSNEQVSEALGTFPANISQPVKSRGISIKKLLIGLTVLVLLLAIGGYYLYSSGIGKIQLASNDNSSPNEELSGAALSFAQASDTQRTYDLQQIGTAIQRYTVENGGILPLGIGTSEREISSDDLDLCEALIPEYLPTIPIDPENTSDGALNGGSVCGKSYTSGYTISSPDGVMIKMRAPNAETKEIILKK
jgi:hypothetical protein